MSQNDEEATRYMMSRGGVLAQHDSTLYRMDDILPYLTESEKKNLERDMVNTLNNGLVRLEDLEVVVPRLLRSCINESKELRQMINSVISSQIAESQRALQMVEDGGSQLQSLRELFVRQGELINSMGVESESYAQLRQLHLLRVNVSSVIDWSLALKEVLHGNLYTLVQNREFMSMYERLKRLQGIRRSVITKAGAEYQTFRPIFEPYFSKLDTVLALFVQEIFAVLTNDVIRVAIHKALDDTNHHVRKEGGSSEFTTLKECVLVCGEEVLNPVLNFGSDGLEHASPITPEKIFEAVSKNVVMLWREQIVTGATDPFTQPALFFEQMRKVEPLLEALEMTLIPVSSTLPFFGFVARALHAELMQSVSEYLKPEAVVGANALIEASQFMMWYKEMITDGNYVRYIDASSVEDMAAALMTSAVGGLAEHLTSLCRACALNAFENPKGPTILPSGHPITTGPMDMFAVLQQTLDSIPASIEQSVMCQIGTACADAICGYLAECRRFSDLYYWENKNDSLKTPHPPDEWQQRRLLLLYACVNDCKNIEGNLDTIEMKFSSSWEYDFKETGAKAEMMPFQRVQDMLSENALYCLDEIMAHVERVVASQWALVFRYPAWYDESPNPIQVIMSTVLDYIREEFISMLPPQSIRRITRQMLVRFVQKYLSVCMEFLADVIRKPKKKYVKDWNIFINHLLRDAELFMLMWMKCSIDRQLVELGRKALDLLKSLLTVKRLTDFKFFVQEKLLDDFGDCPSFVIRFTLQARPKEVSVEMEEHMYAIWQELISHQKRDPITDLPTTGWNHLPSLFGGIDRSIADLAKSTGLFGKSAKKKRQEQQILKAEAEKKIAREAYLMQSQADAPESRAKSAILKGSLKHKSKIIEISTLSEVLKSTEKDTKETLY